MGDAHPKNLPARVPWGKWLVHEIPAEILLLLHNHFQLHSVCKVSESWSLKEVDSSIIMLERNLWTWWEAFENGV